MSTTRLSVPAQHTPRTTAPPEAFGPIDFLLIEFSPDRLTGEAGPALLDLVDRGMVRLLDLLVIGKSEDGTVEEVALTDGSRVGAGFEAFAGARSGLIGEEDLPEVAGAMRPGTVAALMVYENSWAVPFVSAVVDSGGELIASARIPATEVMAALDELESES